MRSHSGLSGRVARLVLCSPSPSLRLSSAVSVLHVLVRSSEIHAYAVARDGSSYAHGLVGSHVRGVVLGGRSGRFNFGCGDGHDGCRPACTRVSCSVISRRARRQSFPPRPTAGMPSRLPPAPISSSSREPASPTSFGRPSSRTPRRRSIYPITLQVGAMSAEVTVTAARGERELRQVPLHVETISDVAVEQMSPLSTGDALATAVNVTPVGNGPFGVRPRLRGLDSTRVLVLVDGERLNTARMATDRTGAEVGLISPSTIERMEIVNGAGTLLYGSDALGRHHQHHHRRALLLSAHQWLYGFNGYYSSNEDGGRGSVTLGFDHATRDRSPADRGRRLRRLHGRQLRRRRTRRACSRRAGSTAAIPSTTPSDFPSTRFPIRSMRLMCAPTRSSRIRARVGTS